MAGRSRPVRSPASESPRVPTTSAPIARRRVRIFWSGSHDTVTGNVLTNSLRGYHTIQPERGSSFTNVSGNTLAGGAFLVWIPNIPVLSPFGLAWECTNGR